MHLIKELDRYLLDLAWSLWTELGIQGHRRKHQNCLISLEELVLFTAILADIDPRLRDESIDWCAQYHHFFSVSRLKSLIKQFGVSVLESFSKYSSTLNAISRAHWPVFQESSPVSIKLSQKSSLRHLESPALFNIRVRSLFGTGARADLITFFLTHKDFDFSVSDTVQIGYSKRNLAEILEDLWLSGLVEKSLLRNQQRYRLLKREQLIKILSPLPTYAPPWRDIFQIILSIRYCLQRIESSSESTQVVEIRNLLLVLHEKLKKLKLTPPIFERDFSKYLSSFAQWFLNTISKLSQGDFEEFHD
jgi:hypothetical protein